MRCRGTNRSRREGFLRGEHTGFGAGQIADVARQAPVELDQKTDGALAHAANRGEQCGELRTGRFRIEKRRQPLAELGRISKRKALGERLDEEVEWIEDRQIGKQIDGHAKFAGLFRKDETRQPVSVRVLQPVHEMRRRHHLERIAHHAGAAMRSRPQANDVRPKRNLPIVTVARDVIETGKNGHGYLHRGC